MSQNLYTYVGNNPLTHIGPTGHYTESEVDAMLSIARNYGGKSQVNGEDQAIKDAVVSMVIGMTSPRSNKPLATQKKVRHCQ